MTIKQIANRIIKDIKAWPEEASQSQDEGGPKTSWDEYKEQIQYEEYDSFEVFEETIASMADDEVSDLSDKVINNLYGTTFTTNYPIHIDEKRKDIINEVLSNIKSEAEEQDIEYSKIDTEYIKYNVDDITIVAEVLSKVGPEEYLIRAYSEVTGAGGEQGRASISDLADEKGFEWISAEEFVRVIKSFRTERLSQAALENENQVNKLLNNENKTDCLLTQKDQLHNPDPVLENKVVKEKAQVAKAVKDLVILTAKATEKSPAEVIRGMKLILDERKAKREHQTMLIEQQEAISNVKIIKNENEAIRASPKATSNNLYMGLDRDIRLAAITLSEVHFNSGIRKFEDFTRAMIEDTGPEIKPYLKQLYAMKIFEPGFDATGMDSLDDIDKVELEHISLMKVTMDDFQKNSQRGPMKLGKDNQDEVGLNSVISPSTPVFDIDGNIYTTVRIGSQEWICENLRTTRFNDGTSIQIVTNDVIWSKLKTPAYCWYDNSGTDYRSIYGALYNWHTINTGKLCPPGWHVPSINEWNVLSDFLGGEIVAGGKLKEVGTKHWKYPNGGSTDKVGFSALPGGIRSHDDGGFEYLGDECVFWTSSNLEGDDFYAWYYRISSNLSNVDSEVICNKNGFSVRCIKD